MDHFRPLRATVRDTRLPDYGLLDDQIDYQQQTGPHSLVPLRPLTMADYEQVTPPGLYERQSSQRSGGQSVIVYDDPVDNYGKLSFKPRTIGLTIMLRVASTSQEPSITTSTLSQRWFECFGKA